MSTSFANATPGLSSNESGEQGVGTQASFASVSDQGQQSGPRSVKVRCATQSLFTVQDQSLNFWDADILLSTL